ncbi:hypothetical protein EVA_10944 [gut metagenome]|uniref:Uncharacterized protein n=1 Tax=gut metagenome TaxID=749906 RepID=J9GGK4_9ZZZZ
MDQKIICKRIAVQFCRCIQICHPVPWGTCHIRSGFFCQNPYIIFSCTR